MLASDRSLHVSQQANQRLINPASDLLCNILRFLPIAKRTELLDHLQLLDRKQQASVQPNINQYVLQHSWPMQLNRLNSAINFVELARNILKQYDHSNDELVEHKLGTWEYRVFNRQFPVEQPVVKAAFAAPHYFDFYSYHSSFIHQLSEAFASIQQTLQERPGLNLQDVLPDCPVRLHELPSEEAAISISQLSTQLASLYGHVVNRLIEKNSIQKPRISLHSGDHSYEQLQKDISGVLALNTRQGFGECLAHRLKRLVPHAKGQGNCNLLGYMTLALFGLVWFSIGLMAFWSSLYHSSHVMYEIATYPNITLASNHTADSNQSMQQPLNTSSGQDAADEEFGQAFGLFYYELLVSYPALCVLLLFNLMVCICCVQPPSQMCFYSISFLLRGEESADTDAALDLEQKYLFWYTVHFPEETASMSPQYVTSPVVSYIDEPAEDQCEIVDDEEAELGQQEEDETTPLLARSRQL